MEDTESTNTSLDDKNDDFDDNSTRTTLSEGMMGLFKPAIELLDERVRATRVSQIELKQQIESLAEDLCRISEAQNTPYDLDVYNKKLMNAKRRVMLVSNIVQNVQERLTRVHHNVLRETSRRKALLEPNTLLPP